MANCYRKYKKIALGIRREIVELVSRTKSPHIGPSFSIVEVLVILYFKVMNIGRNTLRSENRDRFILSKGHACPALYAVLAKKGFISSRTLNRFAVNNGCLRQHPDMNLKYGIELSTGSLGHGLSVGIGMALNALNMKLKHRVFVLLGDGELNEGSVWEAVIFAGHHRLSNLIAIVDQNKMQALGYTKNILDLSPLGAKWRSFGWHVQVVRGHDMKDIDRSFKKLSASKPNVIILDTVKGKGVYFMENQLLWHYRYPHAGEYKETLEALEE